MTYLKNIQKIDNKLLDIELVSIEDYTVSGKISKEFYEEAIQKMNERNDSDEVVPIKRFKAYLIEQF